MIDKALVNRNLTVIMSPEQVVKMLPVFPSLALEANTVNLANVVANELLLSSE